MFGRLAEPLCGERGAGLSSNEYYLVVEGVLGENRLN